MTASVARILCGTTNMRLGCGHSPRWELSMKHKKTLMHVVIALGFSLALAGCLRLHSNGAYLIAHGQPRAKIVISENPPRAVKLAALELQTYLKKISGAKLPIVIAPGTNVTVHIYVGKSKYTNELKITDEGLKYGAFRMVSGKPPQADSQAGWLVLLGHDKDFIPPEFSPRGHYDLPRVMKEWDKRTGEKWGLPIKLIYKSYSPAVGLWDYDERGSLNAVYEFLRGLGARWYMPGNLGEVLPKRKSIALAPLDKTVKPDFPYRNLGVNSPPWYGGSRDAILFRLRIGLEPIMNIPGPHGLNNVNGRAEVKKAHPEFYCDRKTPASNDHYYGSCFSSPEIEAYTVKYARKIFEIYPEMQYVSVWPNDGFRMCHCDLCKGKETPEKGPRGVASDYVWSFVDRVARELYKTHPDKKVICGAYGAYALPPEKIAKFSPNVMVGIVESRVRFNDQNVYTQAMDIRKGYLEKITAGNLYICNHYLYSTYGLNGLPIYFPHVIAKDLRSLKGISQGEFIELSLGKGASDMAAPGFNHLNVYVTARYYWDADQDIDKILDEYYKLYYGPAAKVMKEFIEYSETNWPSMRTKLEPIDRALTLLEAARKSAGDTVYGQRIDLVRDYVRPLKDIRFRLAMDRKDVPRARHIWPVKDAEITIDGRLDEARWKEGGYGWNTYAYGLSELETGRRAYNGTLFRVIWGGRAIYFGMRCDERDMKALNITTTNNDDAALFQGDYLAVLLETQGHSYYQIAVNPAGAVFDADMKDGTNTAWSSSAKVAVYKGDTFWSVEMRIPVGDAIEGGVDPMKCVEGRCPTDLYPWAFNICRQRVRPSETERSAWSPTATNSFLVPLKFGELSNKW